MDLVDRVERTLGVWYGRLPSLPQKLRHWIAANIWWIVLIGAVIMVVGLLGILSVLLLGTMFLSVFAGVYGHALGVIAALLTLIWVASYTVEMILMFMAIPALRTHDIRGWRMLFYVFLLGVAVEIAYVFVSADVGSFIWSMVLTAVGGYVLYQVRDLFVAESDTKHRDLVTKAPDFKPVPEESKARSDT